MYWNLTDKDRLTKAFTLADNPKLMGKFLAEILSEKDIKKCEVKLTALCMLHDLATYKNVEQFTGLSPTTISQLSKVVNNEDSGFRQIIKMLKKQGPAYFD